jgi:hypothetical protein
VHTFAQVIPRNDNPETMCYMMWCGPSQYGRIITSHPALEGTVCREGHQCVTGQCVPVQNVAAVAPTTVAQVCTNYAHV